MANKKLEVTSASSWLTDYEPVLLPSGKVAGLRQVDVLSILTSDGEIPNILMPIVQGNISQSQIQGGEMQMQVKDLVPLNHLLERLTRACFVQPAIVDDMEAVKRGEGITVDMVSYTDKVFLIAWNLGGQERVDAAARFLKEQGTDMGAVQPSNGVSPESEPDTESAPT